MKSFSVRLAAWRDDRVALQSVRIPVFVVEQHVDAREEFDEVDPECRHILAIDADGNPIGTGRIDSQGKIGRMAVLAEWRQRGVGRAILLHAVAVAKAQGLTRVFLHAQVSAMGFYAREGFVGYGERFMEAGIEHLSMQKAL